MLCTPLALCGAAALPRTTPIHRTTAWPRVDPGYVRLRGLCQHRRARASPAERAHPPGLVLRRLLDPFVTRHLTLEDGAYDDDARALDEHGEQHAHERLDDVGAALELGHADCEDRVQAEEQQRREEEATRLLGEEPRAERSDVGKALDLIGPERVERRAALKNRRVLDHHIERVLLAHHLDKDLLRGEHRVAEGVARVHDLRVGLGGGGGQLGGAIYLEHRAPQQLEVAFRVLLLEFLRDVHDLCGHLGRPHIRLGDPHSLHLVGFVDLLDL
mmetsp:Transcript_19886/g.49055  ORF Transcript_19886/g.49055 Transcript_19886/m.49055 type:complete len:273 (-) Transcript_19886:187-1005(-)